MSKVSQSSKDAAFADGQSDRGRDYSPPKGDWFVDMIFAPIDFIAGTPSTTEVAQETRAAYDAGHAQKFK
jgi:hypothetical protein